MTAKEKIKRRNTRKALEAARRVDIRLVGYKIFTDLRSIRLR